MNNLPAKQENFIQLYSVHNCLKSFKKINTEIEAFKSNTHTLVEIKKNSSEKICLSILQAWVISLNDFVNCSRKMGPNQIKELCIYIYNDYYFLKMSDIYLIITRIKKGFYGQLYESIDGMKILGFIEKYANERANSVFNDGIHNHESILYSEAKALKSNRINKMQ